jgi:hypothetical protein
MGAGQPGRDCFLAADRGVLAGLDLSHLLGMHDRIEREPVDIS